MILALRVIQHQNRPPQQELSARVGGGGCTIGRKPGNDLVLPDPQRVISSTHARIESVDDAYYLTDVSTNGTYLNGKHTAVGKNNSVRINHGDELIIGDYVIRVTVERGAPGGAAPTPRPAARDSIIGDMDGDPGSLGSVDPLELLGGGVKPAPAAPSAPPPANSFIPDDWDLLTGAQAPAASQPDTSPADQQAFRPPNVIPDDWDPLSEDDDAAAPPRATAPPAPSREPSAPTPPDPPRTAPAAPPPPSAGAGTNAVAAFLAGAGLTPGDLPPADEAQFMANMGRLLRHMTQGLMANLAGRMNVKNELRLEMTTIRAAENNPLKFSVNVDDALRHLLTGQSKGYLPPLPAVDEAFDDMQAHQMAVMAAMRATLEALLARFNPGELEKSFRRDSLVNNLLQHTPLPKVKYWDLFTERYGQIAKDAEEGFMQQLFAVEFSRAYERQIRAFKAARQHNRP